MQAGSHGCAGSRITRAEINGLPGAARRVAIGHPPDALLPPVPARPAHGPIPVPKIAVNIRYAGA
jgi:hypothetical protein